MTEDQAIKRIADAMLGEAIARDLDEDPLSVYEHLAKVAWNEMKAIAREDARKRYVDKHFMGVDPETCPEWKQELIEVAEYIREHGSLAPS